MLSINALNVNDAWWQAKIFLNSRGILRPSRVGQVLETPHPVTTQYQNPRERVLFDEKRDCNPYFHFFEGLWMLAGRNDVGWISQFNQRMMSFSDNGTTYHAAYGYRWRGHFGRRNQLGDGAIDQLAVIIKALKKDPSDRRCVLQMWDPQVDLGMNGKDFPCNTAVYFKIRDGALHMTVSNRSNDVVWGCYGANCVHMSMMQEYVASMIGVDVGPYNQMSDSWHAYTEYWDTYGGKDTTYLPRDPYSENQVKPYALVKDPTFFDADLLEWMAEPEAELSYTNPVFEEVAKPMYTSWKSYKAKRYYSALSDADDIGASDLRLACIEWLQRRIAAKALPIVVLSDAKEVAA